MWTEVRVTTILGQQNDQDQERAQTHDFIKTIKPVIPKYQPLIEGTSCSLLAGGAVSHICGLGSDGKLVIYPGRLGRERGKRTEMPPGIGII